MEHIWTRITSWIKTHAPQLLELLQDGASEEQINELEKALSIQLPDDVKALYRLCNGQSSFDYGLLNGNEFLSLERIRDEWTVWKDLLDAGDLITDDDIESDRIDTEIRQVWWHPKWIPFTYNGGGDHDCLDLAPAKEGVQGQIISMWHDDEERKLLAPGIREWLQQYAEQLESGQIIFSEDYNGIVSIDNI